MATPGQERVEYRARPEFADIPSGGSQDIDAWRSAREPDVVTAPEERVPDDRDVPTRTDRGLRSLTLLS